MNLLDSMTFVIALAMLHGAIMAEINHLKIKITTKIVLQLVWILTTMTIYGIIK